MKMNEWITFKQQIVALTTTRLGGVSKPPYNELNLAFHSKDSSYHVAENRHRLLTQLGLNHQQWVLTYQSHSDILVKVMKQDAGKGHSSFESGIPADALYTYEKKLAIGVFHADCVPVFLYNPKQKWVGIIHAGTEGTLKKITQKSLTQILQHEKSNPNDIYAYLGPALDFAHHRISETFVHDIVQRDPTNANAIKQISGQFYLDVPLLNMMQLRNVGIPFQQIENSNIDTFSTPELYFSYLREKETGRHLSLIYLLD